MFMKLKTLSRFIDAENEKIERNETKQSKTKSNTHTQEIVREIEKKKKRGNLIFSNREEK